MYLIRFEIGYKALNCGWMNASQQINGHNKKFNANNGVHCKQNERISQSSSYKIEPAERKAFRSNKNRSWLGKPL